MTHVDAECVADEESGEEYMYLAYVPLQFFHEDYYMRILEYGYARTLWGFERTWREMSVGTRYTR